LSSFAFKNVSESLHAGWAIMKGPSSSIKRITRDDNNLAEVDFNDLINQGIQIKD
jgi:hypothetical protein